LTDTEFNAVKAFLSAYRYTELDLRVRRAELTRLTARKEALILEGNTDLLFHLEHAICAAKDAIRVLCTRQAEIEAERKRAREELRKQVAILAVAGAEKIIERSVDEAANSDIVDKLVAEL